MRWRVGRAMRRGPTRPSSRVRRRRGSVMRRARGTHRAGPRATWTTAAPSTRSLNAGCAPSAAPMRATSGEVAMGATTGANHSRYTRSGGTSAAPNPMMRAGTASPLATMSSAMATPAEWPTMATGATPSAVQRAATARDIAGSVAGLGERARAAVARQVRCDDRVRGRERVAHGVPHGIPGMRACAGAVQQQERGPASRRRRRAR
jgi:hypothetical protein